VDIRRNIYRLTPGAVNSFTAALNVLKANGTYDLFVHRHHDAMMRPCLMPGETQAQTLRNSAHRGPAFGPWHRWYLRDLELALKAVDPAVTLPYWDWASDAAMPDPRAAALWSAAYIGGNGAGPNGVVPDGPFIGWVALVMPTGGMTLVPRSFPGLIRELGASIPTLPTTVQVTDSLTEPAYDHDPWSESQTTTPSFRNRVEGWLRRGAEPFEPRMHNRVHVWVGGDMLAGTSPNDPVFFLHHGNVDRLWAQWQRTPASGPYVPAAAGPPGHSLNDAMFDLGTAGITPHSTLDHHAMGYMYDSESIGLSADECGPSAMLTVHPGQTAQIQACYANTGTVTWVRGAASQVNLVAAPLGTSPLATWSTNWLAPNALATTTQAAVAPGQMGMFVFAVTPPAGVAPGRYVVEGELVLAATGEPLLSPTFHQVVMVQ
jgi:tyrosinase